MKVLLLTTHLNIGGVGLYVLNLAKGLKEKGIDCVVASSGGGLEDHFRKAGIPLMYLDIKTKFEFNPKLIPAVRRLINFAKKTDLDIVHAHTRVAQVMAKAISRQSGASFVSTCHGFFNKRRISRIIYPCWGDRVIAISEAVKNHLKDDFKVSPKDITVIHNGIDSEKYQEALEAKDVIALKRKLKIEGGPVLGSIGRLSPVKGYKYLLCALKELKRDFPNLRLVLIGEGPEEQKLRSLTKKLNLEDSVLFINSTLDTKKFLALMDIFVFPSLQEGLGLSLLEAMASGKACIATSIGGISDIIEDGKNGLLVPPADSHCLKEAIKRLLSDKGFSSKIASCARKSVKDKFSMEKMVKGTIAFYESAKRIDAR
ncbi:MAG: glycosyltransferase family 4 protein [Candidatus Omnitrophica bacterium]|nr:glycosyltransferase family 4 protein [Candidatus Omnitrophota bacterium]